MPRNHNPGASTLRNRNRVTNKTRLKIIHGNIDGDPLLIDEDEEKARVISTAGVDAEDANEHHLQAVLNAASQKNQTGSQRSTRGASDKSAPLPAAFIPTPDSTGKVDNYEDFYPPNKWKDPATYIRSSETVEESCAYALTNGFTYFMDERDQDWLEKNNEEARGEGTSAQGALSTPGGSMRLSRSAKSKGKDPEVAQPIAMTEDEFELVMGLYEKVTHDKTEYLHHGFEPGMPFPPFSDYQDTFASPLPASAFETFTVPPWIPTPGQLVRLAQAVYPHWKERRTEREGHRIIPILNGDETDTLNESYICFRRREIKAVRKTRASQATSSDKLLRLQSELSSAIDMAKLILNREMLKRSCAQQSLNVWERRRNLVDLKRKFPSLGTKEDEELLHDKERIPKRIKPENVAGRLGIRLRTRESDFGSPTMPMEPIVRPKERYATIQNDMEVIIRRRKEKDAQWDDQIENIYQQQPVPWPQRIFKYIPPPDVSSWPPSPSSDDEVPIRPRAVRVRLGRGGRMLVDRRQAPQRSFTRSGSDLVAPRVPVLPVRKREHEEDEDEESSRRLAERWMFDADDYPSVGPEGSDEQDRVLVDDYLPRFLRHTMTLIHDSDQQSLVTDPTILVSNADGRQLSVIPYRLGMQQPMRREVQRPYAANAPPVSISAMSQQANPAMMNNTNPNVANGTPISVQTPMKKMQPPSGILQMRISSNGGMRPPIVASMAQTQSSPPPNAAQLPTMNGISRHPSHSSDQDISSTGTPVPNGVMQGQPDGSTPHTETPVHTSPMRQQKSQDQHHAPAPMANGHQHPNGFIHQTNNAQYNLSNSPQSSLDLQKQHHLQAVYGLSTRQVPGSYLGHVMPSHPPTNGVLPATNGVLTNSVMTNGVMANGVMPNGVGPPGVTFNGVHDGNLNGNGIGLGIVNGNGNMNFQIPQTTSMSLNLPHNRKQPHHWPPSPIQRPPSVSNGVDSVQMGGIMSSPNLGHAVPTRSPSSNGFRVNVGDRVRGQMILQGQVGHGQLGPHSMSISPHLQHSSPMPHPGPSPPRPPQTPTMMSSPLLQHQQPVGTTQGGY